MPGRRARYAAVPHLGDTPRNAQAPATRFPGCCAAKTSAGSGGGVPWGENATTRAERRERAKVTVYGFFEPRVTQSVHANAPHPQSNMGLTLLAR